MSYLLIVLVAVPLIAVLVSLLGGWRLARIATALAGLASLGVVIALAITVAHGRTLQAAHGWLRLDSLGAVFLLATGLLYAVAGVFSVGYLHADESTEDFGRFARRYCALLNLFGWSMLLVPLAADFGTLWVAVELTTIVSALLVAIDRTDAALEASWKYVLIASSGLGIALLSIIVLYATGTHALGGAYIPRFVAPVHARPWLLDRRRSAVVRARGRRLRHQGRVCADAHVASGRSQRSAGTSLGDALGLAAVGRVLRDPALLPGRGGSRRALVRASMC